MSFFGFHGDRPLSECWDLAGCAEARWRLHTRRGPLASGWPCLHLGPQNCPLPPAGHGDPCLWEPTGPVCAGDRDSSTCQNVFLNKVISVPRGMLVQQRGYEGTRVRGYEGTRVSHAAPAVSRLSTSSSPPQLRSWDLGRSPGWPGVPAGRGCPGSSPSPVAHGGPAWYDQDCRNSKACVYSLNEYTMSPNSVRALHRGAV